jgi:hypothetical protein
VSSLIGRKQRAGKSELRRRRLALGLSQQQVASFVKCTQPAVSVAEKRGNRKVAARIEQLFASLE